MEIPDAAAHTTIAPARFCGGNIRRMIASVVGMMAAANMPIRARMAMTNSVVVGKQAKTDVEVKPASPMRSVLVSPIRSPSVPAMRRKPAKVSV